LQQVGSKDWSSSANAASRQGMGGPPSGQRAPDSWRPNGGHPGGSYSPSQPAGSYPQQGSYQQQGAGDQRRPNGNGNGGRFRGGNGGGAMGATGAAVVAMAITAGSQSVRFASIGGTRLQIVAAVMMPAPGTLLR
jgi:hypothetical protein